MTAGVADAAQLADPAAVIGLLRRRPRLLALGEPTHGEDVLLDLRNDLFRYLVDHEGYRSVAIESDAVLGLVVDEYVCGGHWFGYAPFDPAHLASIDGLLFVKDTGN